MKNEEFEKWADENLMYGGDRWAAFQGYQMRQPEIDALKAKNDALGHDIKGNLKTIVEFYEENATLQAEVERLGQLIESLSKSSRAEIAGLNKDVAKLKALIGIPADIDPDNDCPC